MKRVIRLIVIIIEESSFYQLSTEFYSTFFQPGYLHMSMKLLGVISVDSVIIDLLFIRLSTFGRYERKKWEYNGMVHQLFIDVKKACDSIKIEVVYNTA
jgi:hypothetical protein